MSLRQRLFLFARTSSVSSLSNSKFQILTLRYVARVVLEAIHEFSLNCGFWPILFALLAKLLELEKIIYYFDYQLLIDPLDEFFDEEE